MSEEKAPVNILFEIGFLFGVPGMNNVNEYLNAKRPMQMNRPGTIVMSDTHLLVADTQGGTGALILSIKNSTFSHIFRYFLDIEDDVNKG